MERAGRVGGWLTGYLGRMVGEESPECRYGRLVGSAGSGVPDGAFVRVGYTSLASSYWAPFSETSRYVIMPMHGIDAI